MGVSGDKVVNWYRPLGAGRLISSRRMRAHYAVDFGVHLLEINDYILIFVAACGSWFGNAVYIL